MITQFKEFPDRINTAGKDFETVLRASILPSVFAGPRDHREF